MKRNSLLHVCAGMCASFSKQFEWKNVQSAPVLGSFSFAETFLQRKAVNNSDNLQLPIFKFEMRKAGFLTVVLMAFLLNVRQGWGQSAGFNNTFIVLSLNGGANTFYDLNAATANTDFNNANLGTFAPGSTNLTLKGAEHNVFKCGGADLTSTRLYYRVYPTASPSGSYTSQSIGFTSGFGNGCGGQDQVWSNTGLTINILAGLGAGAYTLEVYSDATITCCGGTAFASNSGNNYKATFTVSTIVWANTAGATAWYTAANWNPSTASGAWVPGSVAEFRNSGSATTAGINMGTAALSIGQIDVTAARTRVLTIGSSSSNGTLTLNGAPAGSNPSLILRNSSASLLTLQNNETGTGKTMNIALGNATTNTIDAAGSGGITISSVISGASRSITKIGTGTLTLSGTNTYSGGTIISGGTVSAGAAANLGDAAGAITLGSGATSATLAATGTFTRNALNVTTSSTAGVIDVATSQTLTLAALNTASGTDNTTKCGKSGAGTLTLSGAGSYVGQTQIGEGTVIVSNNAGLGTNNSTTARGIDLGLNVGDVSQANNVSVLATNGITVPQSIYVAPNTTAATRTIGTSGATASATFSNEVYLDGTASLAPVSGGTLTMSGNIINTGGLITTTGTTLLSGTNTFSGTTTVSSGTLRLGSTSALGSSAAATSITSGAVLDLNGINYSSAEALTVNGTGISSGGAVINGSATGATYAGLLTLGSASSIVGGSGTIAISNTGTITGSGFGLTLGGAQGGSIASIIGTGAGSLTKQDAGTWTLSGANTYSGATTISAGTLRLGAAGVIADGSAISLSGGSLSSGASAGFSETMGALALTANSTIALGTGNHSLTFANSSAVSWTAATTLTITGWTGTAGASGTAGKIFVSNTTGTLTSGQLAQISFSGYSAGAMLLNTGEVVPLLTSPTVATTVAASSITNTSASTGGQTIAGSGLTAKGVVYSTAAVSTTPTLSNSVLTDGGTTTANFSSNLTGLSPETQYYVRAYATNAAGTGYGPAINFRTLSNPATAQASGLGATASASGTLTINWTGATFPGTGATQGGYALIYGTGTPTLSSANGAAPAAGVGALVTITPTNLPTAPATSFVLTGLTGGTTYNFLLVPFTWDGTNAETYNYLTTSAPTTSAVAVTNPAIITTTAITSITNASAASGGSGISANGGTISAKGVVWNTATAPTTANSSTNDGTGTASFSSSLTSLSAQTLYYVRSYATNAVGTAYGNELSFYTLSNEPTAAATSFTATANGSSQIDLTWTAATFPGAGATNNGYIILRRIDSTNPTTTSVTDGVAPASLSLPSGTTLATTITSGATTSYNNTGLASSSQYNYIIIPFTWDGSNAATYNYYLTSAPNANATTAAGFATVDVTTAASSITNNSASSGGSSLVEGGSAITAKGVAYNTSTLPTTANSTTNDGSGTANFSSSLTGLSAQTLYYVRAYVTNSSGTGYGNEITFRTVSNPATAQASGLSASVSASGELTISWTGATFPSSGATQGGYALVYSTGTPTLSSANGAAPAAGLGTLVTITPTNLPTAPATSYVLSGLTGGTTYNFLLVPFTWNGTNATTYNYLTTSAPTASATAVTTASVTTTAASSVTNTTASSGGSALAAGGGTISAKGVVWNTVTAPTTANSSTNDGTGTASYTSSLTSLSPETLHYYRAYATNEVGTVYGAELTFRTLSNPPTAQATGLTATASSSSNINLNWSAATFPVSGATTTGYVLLRATSPNTPSLGNGNGAAPTAGTNTTIVSSSISGAATSAASSTLASSTTYNYLLVPFTWDGTNATTYNYLTASAPTAAATTLAALPGAQPTALVFSAVTATTITTSWTAATGSPTGYIVLRSAVASPDTDPVPGISYTTGNTLGNATVVYAGTLSTTGSQTGLVDGTTYYYEVFSYNGGGSTINYLTTSPLNGSQATTSITAPVATTATSAAATSFTANWGAVSGAANYLLDVSTNPCFASFGSSSTATEGFAGGTTAPTGWTFTTIATTYTSAGNFGAASPSVQMDATGDRVLTNQLSGAAASQLSFWLKGNGTNAASALLVEGTTDGTNWVTIENITASIPTTGTTKTYNFSSTPLLPCGMIQFRFTYTKNAGNLAFDDVSITSASSTPDFVSGYNSLSVSGTSSSVTGLTSSTTYYYRVRAVGTNSTSTNSNVITAATLNDPATADYRSVATGNYTSASTWEYNSIGSTWVAATQAPTAASNVTIQAAHTVTLDASQSINAGKTLTIAGTLDAGANNISGAGLVAMGAASTIITSSASGLAGALQVTTPASCTFTAGAKFHFTGTAVNTGFASFTGVGSFTFYNIVWAGSTSLTLDKNIRVQNFDFTNNGLVYLGNFDLSVSYTGVINGSPFSSSKMFVTSGTGTMYRFVVLSSGIPFTWPIGDVTGTAEYSPVTVGTIAGNTSITSSIGFKVTDAADPNNGLASNYISRYWTFASSNLTAGATWGNATFTYTAADIVGTEALLKANAFNSGTSSWTEFASSSAASNVLTFTSGASTTTVLTGNTITARVDPPLYYRSASSGNWGTSSTWLVSTDPAFVAPAGAAATSAPTATNSMGITIMAGHSITSSASVAADQLTIQSTGSLEMTNNALTISDGTGTDVAISSGGTLLLSGTATITINSGATIQVDGLYKVSSTAAPVVTNAGTTTVSSTGTYEHARDAGIIPTCTWNSGSTCLITGTGNNAPTGLAQSFHHFTVNTTLTNSVNCSGALQTINGKFKLTTNDASFGWRLTGTTNYTLNIADSLIISNGILDASSGGSTGTINANGAIVMSGPSSQITKTGAATITINANNNFTQNAGIIEFNAGGSSNTTWNIKGDFVQGGTIQRTNGGTHVLNFNKASGVQTWTQTGTYGTGAMTINVGSSTTNTLQLLSNISLGTSAQVFNVTNGATLDMGPYVMTGTSSTFAVGATGAVKFGNVNGITTAPTASGNVQTLTRTFPGTASYFYNGTANQVTGNALPSTLTGTGNLNIQSSSGVVVTLINNNTTTPTFNLLSGLFAAGNTQQLNITSGGTVNATGGDWVANNTAGRLNFPGSGTFTGSCNPYNVYTSGGVNFGSGTVTIQNGGTFRINNGGFVNTNAPFYGSGSTLQYWINGTYGRGLEWSASSGRGYPHHVQISNNTTVNPANTGATQANTPLRTAGNLTIDSGSNFYMDSGGNNMIEDLVVGGNLSLTGSFSGSQASGSDIFVGGNWQNDGTSANFFPNSRAVFLNGTGTQTISGTNASFPAFPFLFIDKTAGSVDLSRDVQVTELLNFSATNVANVSTGTNALFVSKNTTTAVERLGSGHVIGNLRRAVTTGSNTYEYPIGDATVYAPVSLALSSVTTSGNITASTTAGDQAQITSSGLDGAKSVNRFYTLTNSGVTLASYSPTFNFVSGDLDAGVNTSSLLVGVYNSAWTYPAVGTRTATSTQATGVSSFGQFALAECRTPQVYNVTGGGSYCESSGGVSVGLDGSELGVSYQLQRNGSDIGSSVPGTGSAISFGNQTSVGTYSVVANSTASIGCSASMTGSVLVTVNAVVNTSVSINTTATTICDGSSVTFTATPQFGGTSPVYQWKVNGSNVGTNSSTYTSSALVNGDVVTCDMTSNEECPSPATAISNSITMSVLLFGTPTLTIASPTGTTLCSGDVITISSTPTFEGNLPSYDWKVNGTSVGETEASYSTFGLVNGDQVSCVLTSDYLCANSPTATSNTITFTVVTPPQVDAGSNMTTCGTTPYTFANGATNSNTTSIAWTENGAGSITAGANTLTPTYTPAAGDFGNVVTFTLTGLGSSPCAEIADNVTLQVDGLTLYYNDADGDGFGDPLSSPVASCTPVAGRVADNTDCCDSNEDINPNSEWWADADGDGVGGFIFATGCISGCSGFASTIPYYPGAHGGAPYAIDCNDAASTAFPGASELCGNSVDDDCDLTIDEGCSGIANDGFANATLINVSSSAYPQCSQINGSVLNADISGEGNPANVSAGGGRDSWYRFVAPSTAAQIRVVPNGFNAVIELRTAAHPVGQVDVENVNGAVGGTEVMNVSGLTQGQTYYIAVRNQAATAGGTFTLCVSPLLASGCGTAQAVGGLNLCSSFRALYRGATSYTFNFTGTGGTAPTPFVTTSATTSGLVPLSTASLALRNGGVYSVRVDANFALTNGIGGADPVITLQGTACSRTMAVAPLMEVMTSQRCATATLNRSSLLRAVTTTGQSSACSAISYNFRITRVADCAGTAIPGEVPFVVSSSSTYLSLNVAFPNSSYPLPNIGFWKVEIAPVFSYAATAYGPSQIIKVNNTAASMMLPEVAESEDRMDMMDAVASVYPNPSNGQFVIVSTETESVVTNWNVIDELGRKVEGYSIISMDGTRYEVSFSNTLANGLYYISWFADGEMKNVRWLVAK